MLVVAKDLQTQYEKALDSASISRELRPHFRKWLRFFLDFFLRPLLANPLGNRPFFQGFRLNSV